MTATSSKMTLAPVFYTLAQVQFNPITQMSDYVAHLQERLRRSGFPDFRDENQVELEIRRLDESQPDVRHIPHRRWSFTNTECTEGYVLLSNALVFHTTRYETFADFLNKTISGLSLVHEIVELAYVERIGLRYLDAVVPMDNDTLQQYLSPSLLGFSPSLQGSLNHSFTETVTTIGSGNLVARALITDGGLALSPDLMLLQLKLKPRFTEINGRNAVLDTDYFVVRRDSFDLKEIEDQLLKAHDIIANAFNVSVTEYAREKWA
ncbi:TIGR04255 family protein [Nostoc sp. FACHB-87]|uniref:TIGR04255 family protein n=1 Tax=Nostocales TaxID=1161 RepID=UPI001687DA45|nr:MULTISPECIES: TIGR04255 family protein [Nostocales]MBD2298817.1 TIGR04255 family protein [Nostoc sp. FACHB-190]MBD2457616.1 TIGR04255 family protein [Nostoc sp. FACHB-87]MBD2477489.1 TIGR04255 family protein [Anabaena sp. FACHB-83]MBD2487664.1 TIGR04255 family protein [Aulosira sp. FACHB-615]